MNFKTELDRSKPFGTTISEDGGRLFVQDGIDFNAHGKRLTPLTQEEKELAEEMEIVREAKARLAAKKKAAMNKKTELDSEIEAAKPKKPERDDIPEFKNWTKSQMAQHAAEKFHVDLDQRKTHAALVKQMTDLYNG